MIKEVLLFLFGTYHAFLAGWYQARFEVFKNPKDDARSKAHEYLSDIGYRLKPMPKDWR